MPIEKVWLKQFIMQHLALQKSCWTMLSLFDWQTVTPISHDENLTQYLNVLILGNKEETRRDKTGT